MSILIKILAGDFEEISYQHCGWCLPSFLTLSLSSGLISHTR